MSKTTLNKIFLLSTVLLFSITVFTLLMFSGDSKASEEVLDEKVPLQNVTPPTLPAELSFSGESVPLDIFYVRESLDRELLVNTYWHSSTILLIKRANRWFPVIEPILEKNNIPEDFKYLALIESGFTKVVSPKGAAGFWQFLEKTAREYKLEVNSHVDERYHVEKATEAASAYFLESYENFGNWTLVAASYNAGKRRISESLAKQQTDNYYSLYLNQETSRYVFRILAIKNIFENIETFGFDIKKDELYPVIRTKNIEISTSINNLASFAKENGMNYRMLKELNPWLKSSSLPVTAGKSYEIKLMAN